ncbi:hypothetical protein QZH41_015376, partial [Actinostola sp. cb2023]
MDNPPTTYITYPKSKYILKPNSSEELEDTLRRIHHKLQNTMAKIKPRHKWTNINPTEKQAITSHLRNRPYIYLPSDKGTEFCVIDQQTYITSALGHLNDSSTYKKVPRMTAKTIENKINTVCKNISKENSIPLRVQKSFTASNTDLPRFYHLIKTHKLDQGIKIRPIFSPSTTYILHSNPRYTSKPKDRLPMGSSVSAILAILFKDNLEIRSLHQHLQKI